MWYSETVDLYDGLVRVSDDIPLADDSYRYTAMSPVLSIYLVQQRRKRLNAAVQ